MTQTVPASQQLNQDSQSLSPAVAPAFAFANTVTDSPSEDSPAKLATQPSPSQTPIARGRLLTADGRLAAERNEPEEESAEEDAVEVDATIEVEVDQPPAPDMDLDLAESLLADGRINAFTKLAAAQKAQTKPSRKMDRNQFVADQADESEEDERYGGILNTQRGQDDDDGSDLEGSVKDLVDDEKIDASEQAAQDKLAAERFR